MANILETNAWLVAFGNTTASVANTITDQGVLLEELEDFEPSNIKVMCQTARRPGGTIFVVGVDPLIIPRPVMPNPGVAVPAILELKLQITVTAARYHSSVGRAVEPGIMSWAQVKQFKYLSDTTLNWTAPPSLPELGRSVPIMKLLKLIRDYLRGRLGIR